MCEIGKQQYRVYFHTTPELKEYLKKLCIGSSDILRLAFYKAIDELDRTERIDGNSSKQAASVIMSIRIDFESFAFVKSLKKSERERLFSLVSKIALELAKERLGLMKRVGEKVRNFKQKGKNGL